MITIKNLSFGYTRSYRLFNALDCEFQKGNIYGLLGRNGAGKTTLLKIISGLLNPDAGYCTVLGYKSFDRDPGMLGDIFFVPENFFLPSIKIDQYVKINSPFYPGFDHQEFSRYLNEFELVGDHSLSNLSFGQKKKAFLAFALACNTGVLILDEPTNALDIPSKTQLRKILAGAAGENRCTIISTHQVRDLEALIDPVIILEQGNVIFNQSIDRISEKLTFSRMVTPEDDAGAIFSENTMGGTLSVMENTTGHSTRPNLELLFNAVLHKKDAVNQLFNK